VVAINPNEYEKIESFKEIKKNKGMKFCLCLVEMADYLVFQRYKMAEGFKKFLKEYMDEESSGEEKVRKEMHKLRELMKKEKIVTPGVAEEVNHALENDMLVYEITESGVEEFREEKLKSDIPPPLEDTLYNTLKRLIDAFKAKKLNSIEPPFWWLSN